MRCGLIYLCKYTEINFQDLEYILEDKTQKSINQRGLEEYFPKFFDTFENYENEVLERKLYFVFREQMCRFFRELLEILDKYTNTYISQTYARDSS